MVQDKINLLQPEYVETIPEVLRHGILYISKKYSTAIHLCACGCGFEIVTPLKNNMWRMIEKDKMVTLRPSIGNYGFRCKSHYFITDNQVEWLNK